MKTSVYILFSILVASPAFAAAKRGHKYGGASDGLPPKWGSLIQPAPQTDLPSGLITSDLSGKDLQFLSAAIESGRIQMWLCKTAKEKAETDQVRAVGDALEATQAQENTYLTRLAAKKGLTVSNAAQPLSEKKVSQEFASLSGPQFDKAIMERIISVAQGAVTSYEQAVLSSDGEIKSTVERLLPVAKDKLLLATKISTRPAFRTGLLAPIPQAPAPAAPASARPYVVKPGATPAASPAPAPLPDKAYLKPMATPAASPAPSPDKAFLKPAATPAASPAPLPDKAYLKPLATPPATPVAAAPALPAGGVPPRPAGPKPVPASVYAPVSVPATPAATPAAAPVPTLYTPPAKAAK